MLKKYKFRCKQIGERIDAFESDEHIIEVEATDADTAHDMAIEKFEKLHKAEIEALEFENKHIDEWTQAVEIKETLFFDKHKSIPPNKNVLKKIFKEKGGA